MSSIIKKLIIALGITIILGAGYYFYTTLNTASQGTLADEYTISGSPVSLRTQKIVADINVVESYSLDVSLFLDKRFTTLIDTRVIIPDVETGRINPFASVE